MRRNKPKTHGRARAKRSLLVLLLIGCLGGSGYLLYKGFLELGERQAADTFYAELATSAEEVPVDTLLSATLEEPEDTPLSQSEIDFETLWETCPDVVGWIYLEDSAIDYPIVQGDDNSYYLSHLPDGTANQSGSIMMDQVNSDDFGDTVTILHGHHMKNGSMFGDLSDYRNEEYYQAHSILRLYTPEGDYDVAIFAACTVNGTTFGYPTSFEDEAAFDQFIRKLVSATGYETDVEVHYGDRILLLSTCEYSFSGARFVVLGKILDAEE